MTTPELINAAQVAEILGIGKNTVYEAAARGEIPCRRVGKRFLFCKPTIVAWLSEQECSVQKGT